MDRLRFDAESLILSGYSVETNSDIAGFASNGAIVKLTSPVGTVSKTISASEVGTYDIEVAYFDENDGVSTARILLNGVEIEGSSWAFDAVSNSTRPSANNLYIFRLEGVTLAEGDVLTIEGTQNEGENARLDYIDLISTDTTTTPTDPTNPPPDSTNTAPTATDDSYTVDAGNTLAVAANNGVIVNDIDADGDTLSVSLAQGVSHGSLTLSADGSFTYTPNSGFSGTDSFTYTLNDGNGGTTSGTVTLTVNPASTSEPPPDEEPTPTADPLRIEAEDMMLGGSYGVEAKNFASNGEYIGLSGASGTATTTFTGPSGTYQIVVGYYDESDGEATLTVNIGGNSIDSWQFDNSPGGTRAEATNFTLRTITTSLAINTGDLIELVGLRESGENARVDYIEFIPVGPANEAPVAQADAYSTNEDAVLVIDAAAGVLSNDSDPEGDALTVSAYDSASAAGGTVVMNSDGSFTYTPAADFNGNDTFTYTVRDANGGTATQTVAITVNAANDAPVAADDSLNTAANTPLTFAAADLLDNDSDIDGDSLTIIGLTNPGNGTLTDNGDGTYTYTPNSSFSGVDTFTYTISDGNGETATATVNIAVDSANTPPVAENDAIATNEDKPILISAATLLGNDSDIDGDTLSISVGNPANGTLIDNGDGTYTYTPNSGFTGTDNFTYTVDDGNGGTDMATVTVTVNPQPPVSLDPIRFEAEDMTLGGNYQIESKDFASAGEYIGLTGLNGTAQTAFTGASGTYQIVVGYYDESDGESTLTVNIGGNQIDTWQFDNSPGGSRAEARNFTLRTIATELTVNTGDLIELLGLQESGENARVDYIEFIPVGEPAPDETAPTASLDANSASVTLGSNQEYFFTVEYSDNVGVDVDTLGNNDIRVIGPDGSSSLARLVSVDNSTDGTPRVATYAFTPTGGTWDADELGTYSVQLEANQVTDLAGNAIPSGTLGSFQIREVSSADTADYSSAANGVILNLSTEVALAPVFGALANPRLMPLGDSITAGQHSRGAFPGGYRIRFWDRAVTDGLNIDFVGADNNGEGNTLTYDDPNSSFSDTTMALLDGDHEGYPGETINWIRTNRIESGALDQNPTDAILLMIGTNDVNQGSSGADMIGRLRNLIESILLEDSDVYVFVSSIPPVDAPRGSSSEATAIAEYNSLIPGLADDYDNVFFVNAGGSLTVAEINGDSSALSSDTSDDGLHPTENGYYKLGDAWYDGIFNPESLAGKTNLIGSGSDDILIGNTSSNVLAGGAGADQLTGGGGADFFEYSSRFHGLDEITDFSSNDTFLISAAGFGGGLVAGMSLDSSTFIVNGNPVSGSGTFLFSTSSWTLSYDQDGTGSGSALAIATFTNGYSSLTADQIQIVA